ncbi:MAG: DNA-binding protein WhiA [Candidatus Ancillula sp.]|jgi:DNA-binding protein WhiA|nr:DNA-binding protein WhiA [Candidatus Ancillula sp.]
MINTSEEIKASLLGRTPEDDIATLIETCAMFSIAAVVSGKNPSDAVIHFNLNSQDVAVRIVSNIQRLVPKFNDEYFEISDTSNRVTLNIVKDVVPLLRELQLLDHQGLPYKGFNPDIILCDDKYIKDALIGLFLVRGTASTPKKNGIIEFSCPTENLALAIVGLIDRIHVLSSHRVVNNQARVSIKGMQNMVDLLRTIGAEDVAQSWEKRVEDCEISKNTNRLVNFDMANITRAAQAAATACNAIREAYEIIGYNNIPESLREAGDLRLKFPNYSLQELIDESEFNVSKHALAGRLRKLSSLATSLKKG